MLTFVWHEGGLDFAEVIEDRHGFSIVVSTNLDFQGFNFNIWK
jgi:hypothetical protein